MSESRSELEIRRAIALLKQQYESLLRTNAPEDECAGCLAVLGFGGWILGEQSEEAVTFRKMIAKMRAMMRRHAAGN